MGQLQDEELVERFVRNRGTWVDYGDVLYSTVAEGHAFLFDQTTLAYFPYEKSGRANWDGIKIVYLGEELSFLPFTTCDEINEKCKQFVVDTLRRKKLRAIG